MIDNSKSSSSESQDLAGGLNLMSQIDQAIVASLEPRELIWEIYRQTHKVIPADIFSLSLLTDAPDKIDLFAVDEGQIVQDRRPIGSLTRWVVEQRMLFSTPDDQIQPPPVSVTRIQTGVAGEPRAYILIPMITRDKIVGVVSVQSYAPNAFNDTHLAMLSAIASHSAIVIENNRLLAQAKQRTAELASLERIGYELARLTNIDDVLKEIITEAKNLLGADSMSIFAYDERRGKFRHPAFIINSGETAPVRRAQPPRAKGLTIQIVLQHHAVLTEVATDGQIHFEEIPMGQSVDLSQRRVLEFVDQDTFDFLHNQGIHSSIGFPLSAGRDIVGVLYVNYQQPHAFDQDELQSIGRLAQYAGTAIQRANVYDEIQALHQAGHALASQTEMRAVLTKLVEYGHAILGADLITIFPYQAATNEFELPPVASGEALEPDKRIPTRVASDDTVRRIVKLKGAHFSQDAQTDRLLVGSAPNLWKSRFVSRERIASAAAMPLRANGEVVGALFFNYRTKQRFGSHQRMLIETFATYAATAIQRARLLGQLRKNLDRRLSELNAFAEIDKAITSSSLPVVFERILDAAMEITNNQGGRGNIVLVDESGEYLDLPIATRGGEWQEGTQEKFKIGGKGITGWVALNKAPARIADLSAEGWWTEWYAEIYPDTRSELTVPMLDDAGQLIGVINLESPAPGAFSSDDERLLMALAKQGVIAFQNAQRYEAAQRGKRELEVLAEVDRAISSTLILEKVLQLILESALELVHAPTGNIMLYDTERDDLWMAVEHETLPEYKGARQSLEKGIVGKAAREQKALRIGDVTQPQWNEIYLRFIGNAHSELAVPMLKGSELVGVLNVESSEIDAFSAADERLLKALGLQAVLAIQNSQRYEAELRARRELEGLAEIDRAISSTLELNEVLLLILDKALELVGAPKGNIKLYDPRHEDFYTVAGRGEAPERRLIRQKITEGVIGMAARERRAIRVDNTEDAPWKDIFLREITDTRSELAVPMLRDGELVGVINLESPVVRAFGVNDERLLPRLAGQAVIAVKNAELYQRALKGRASVEALRAVDGAISQRQELESVMRLLIEQGMRLAGAECGEVFNYDPLNDELEQWVLIDAIHHTPPVVQVGREKLVLKATESITGYVAKTGQPYLSHGDVQQDASVHYVGYDDIHSELAVPLVIGDVLEGVLNLESRDYNAFNDEDLEMLVTFAGQAAVAIQNARHIEEAERARARLRVLYDFGRRIIDTPLDTDQLLDLALAVAKERTNAHALSARWWDVDQGTLIVRRRLGESHERAWEPIRLTEASANAWVALHKETLYIRDVDHPPEGVPFRRGHADTKSELIVPLLIGDTYWGNLDLARPAVNDFDEDEIKLVQGIAAQLAVAIQRVQQHQAIEQENRRRQEAEAMSRMGLAAAQITHRIGNNLGPVKAYVQEIRRIIGDGNLEANARLQEIIERVSGALALEMELKKVIANDQELAQAKQIIPIGTILSDASRTCSVPGNVRVELAYPTEVLSIMADGRIHEVFRNLFTNAVQALMPDGGWIQLGAQPTNGEILFWISDNGPGIPKEKRERIFDLFYSSKPESLGFGLWDAKRIVLAHGGSIEVESELGKGTTFKIRLPKSRGPA